MLGFKIPKDDVKYKWTNHVKDKMLYYGISEGLIKRIVRFPKRKEDGIAPRTVAVMQPTSNKKKPQEIWVMYQEVQSEKRKAKNKDAKSNVLNFPFDTLRSRKRIISAWRYPGVSPIGKPIIIPDEILQELDNLVD